ncbi:MAG: hypothetical protein FWG53_04650 [Clostridiales bacterium]|nr:hypothetical protein [Clostridiales bacterium]
MTGSRRIPKKSINRVVLVPTVAFFLMIGVFYIILGACTVKYGMPTVRFDKDPILHIYPKIEKVDSVVWIADTFGSIDFGLSEYWIKGYIKLSDDNTEIANFPEWEPDANFTPDFLPDDINIDGDIWLRSEAFNKLYEGDVMFITEFHFSPKNLLLYFVTESN